MFFSVKSATKIAGKSYKPCICYPVTKFLEETVRKLSSTGKAVIYPEKVFFQNGKILVKTAPVAEKKTSKKEKKAEIKEKVKEEVKEEESLDEAITEDSIVLEEDTTDESEGF